MTYYGQRKREGVGGGDGGSALPVENKIRGRGRISFASKPPLKFTRKEEEEGVGGGGGWGGGVADIF